MEKLSFFSKNLRTWLFANDKTLDQLAAALGLTGPAIGKWVRLDRPPNTPTLRQLCGYIGFDPVEFVGEDLTYKILTKAGYTDSLVADKSEDKVYADNADRTRLIKHIKMLNEKLKGLMQESETVLDSMI